MLLIAYKIHCIKLFNRKKEKIEYTDKTFMKISQVPQICINSKIAKQLNVYRETIKICLLAKMLNKEQILGKFLIFEKKEINQLQKRIIYQIIL